MGDLWNPFDKDNPVYVKVAKKTGQTRRMAQMQVASLAVLAVLAIETGRKRGLYDQPSASEDIETTELTE